MNYCPNCGTKITKNQDFCLGCGKALKNNYSLPNSNIETRDDLKIFYAIISLFFPIVGAIMYYLFKKTNLEMAKTCNMFSWLGFLIMFLLIFWWLPFIFVK